MADLFRAYSGSWEREVVDSNLIFFSSACHVHALLADERGVHLKVILLLHDPCYISAVLANIL